MSDRPRLPSIPERPPENIDHESTTKDKLSRLLDLFNFNLNVFYSYFDKELKDLEPILHDFSIQQKYIFLPITVNEWEAKISYLTYLYTLLFEAFRVALYNVKPDSHVTPEISDNIIRFITTYVQDRGTYIQYMSRIAHQIRSAAKNTWDVEVLFNEYIKAVKAIGNGFEMHTIPMQNFLGIRNNAQIEHLLRQSLQERNEGKNPLRLSQPLFKEPHHLYHVQVPGNYQY